MSTNKETVRKLFRELQEAERKITCGDEAEQTYHQIHKHRFQKILEICKRLVPLPGSSVLDIGTSYLTQLLAGYYTDVSTLGLDTNTDEGGQLIPSSKKFDLPHITFDLRLAPYPDRWPDIQKTYDLIVYAETIEHLPIAPEYSLAFLGSLLDKNGLLLVTTPNAAMIMKRFILLLKGKNPYGQIRLFDENPGHYREYTMNELIAIGARCRLEPVHMEFVNFYLFGNYFYRILKNLKPSMRDSLIIAFRNQPF